VSWRNLLALAVLFVLCASTSFAQWTELPFLPAPRSNGAVAYLDGKLYVFGGVVGSGQQTSQVTDGLSLDVANNASDWVSVASLDNPRWGSYAAAVNGKIYIIGGIFVNQQTGSYSFVTRVAEYDPAKNSFTLKANMPVPVCQMSGTVIDGKIYIFGGLGVANSQFALTNMVQMYDPATDTWTQVGAGPSTAEFTTATSIGNTVYLMGGDAGSPYPNVYTGTVSGSSITWKPGIDLPIALTAASSGVLNGKIYVAGGNTGSALSSRTMVFDPATKKWSNTFGLPQASAQVTSLLGDGTSGLYLIGGVDNPNVYKFVEGESKPVAHVGGNELIFTLEKGSATQGTISFENRGTQALTVTPTVPGTASWLTTSALSLQPGQSSDLVFNVNAASLNAGYYSANVDVALNDPDNKSTTITVRLFVVDKLVAQPTKVVIEEGTGDWCGYCPYGHQALQDIVDTYGDQVIPISYHGGSADEPMMLAAGQSLLNKLGIQGYPNAAIQRWLFPGEGVQMTNRGQWAGYVDQVFSEQPNAPVSITIDNLNADVAAKKLTATVHVTVGKAFHIDGGSSIALTAILLQDSIVYRQHYYTVDNQGNVTAQSDINPYYHRDVVRAIIPNENGMTLDVPAASTQDGLIVPGTTINQDITVPLNVGTSAIPFDVTKAKLVVLVSQNTGSALGPILQAAELSASNTAAPVIGLASGETSKTVTTNQTALFTAQINNLTAASTDITVTRVSNQLPTGWESQVGINDTWNGSDQNGPFTLTAAAGASASVQLKVSPTSDGTGTVTLRFASGATSIDREYTVTAGTAGVDRAVAGTTVLALSNYPNPVNGTTNFMYELSKSGTAAIEIYTLTGEKVATVASGFRSAGSYSVDFDATGLQNGVYAVVLNSNGLKVTRFMTVVH
jgi:N-acetylneuraminic acid mutarotase